MATITASTLQATGTVPNLTCNDVNKSIEFYEAIGFAIEERWEKDGKLTGAMLRAGSARIGLDQDDFKKGRDRKKGVGMRFWFPTQQDVDDLARRVKSNGVKLVREPYKEWGMHGFDVIDPDGFMISISTEPEKQA